MSVVRVAKRELPYTQISNQALRDSSLSFEARGLRDYLLSFPHDWHVSVANLAKASPNAARDRIYRMLRELRDHGYVTYSEVRDPATGRVTSTEYTVHEAPQDPTAEAPPDPVPCFPDTEEPDAANTDAYKEGKNTKNDSPPSEERIVRDPRPDVDRLCEQLRDRVVANGYREPTIGAKWRTDMRLLLDRDGAAADEVARVIDWATGDSFWHQNIRCPEKLRKHWDVLREQAANGGRTRPPRQDNARRRPDAEYASGF